MLNAGCLVYLHHHLLPGERMAARAVATAQHARGQGGALQLHGDVAALLLQRAGQAFEARLLLLHRGQDASCRAQVVVLHGVGVLVALVSNFRGGG